MIIVVSGIHRSGTSAMMNALVEGGIAPIWDRAREKKMQLTNTQDYTVNKDGFWEVGDNQYMRYGFTSELPNDCVVKIQAKGLPILAPSKGYKIIYIRRDPDAIKRSYLKAFGENSFNRLYGDNWPNYYWSLLDGVRGIMQQRRDVELLEIQFDDLIDNPEGIFTRIKAMGVDIDINKAAATIDAKQRRF